MSKISPWWRTKDLVSANDVQAFLLHFYIFLYCSLSNVLPMVKFADVCACLYYCI